MAEQQLKRYPAYRQAAEEISNLFEYGDFLSKRDIYDLLGIEELEIGSKKDFDAHNLKVLSAIQGLKDTLLNENQMLLVSVWGKGYRILDPEEQTQHAMSDLGEEIARSRRKALSRLVNVNMSKLTDQQVNENTEAIARVAQLETFSRRMSEGYKLIDTK